MLLAALCALPFGIRGQPTLPEFSSDTLRAKAHLSPVYTGYQGTGATVIAYSAHCYWPEVRSYLVLVKEHDTWKLYRWKATLAHRASAEIKRLRKKRMRLRTGRIDSLLSEWNAHGFWDLQQDSLNITDVPMGDGRVMSMAITDGCSDVFKVLHRGSYRVRSSYMPDAYQKEFPIASREAVLRCRKAFLRVIAE